MEKPNVDPLLEDPALLARWFHDRIREAIELEGSDRVMSREMPGQKLERIKTWDTETPEARELLTNVCARLQRRLRQSS